MPSDRSLLILGAGTFAVEVLEAAELANIPVAGFVVSEERFRSQSHVEGLPVHTLGDLPWQAHEVVCIAGIISTRRQEIVDRMAERGFEFAALRHPSAIVSRRARCEPGAFIGAGCIVSANTTVGGHAILNRGANVAHDVRIGTFVTVGPNAVIAGGVVVASRAWIGVGSVVRDHIEIGEGSVVGAGSVVVKAVPPHVVVTGVPAKITREGVDGY